jgi:hypothetical protein
MDKFYGFDLGDAESAVSRLDGMEMAVPEVLKVRDAESFITAVAVRTTGELLIGESACYEPGAVRRKLRFKSRFLSDPQSARDVKSFAAGVLGELYADGNLTKGDDCCFYIGCPAGWDRNAREQYREIFEAAGYPPVKIVSESRAALVSACQSKHLQVGYDIMSRPVLVVDIGSSTTDFAYICGGKEEELQTGGEVTLGGGIMDEILLDESLRASKEEKKIRRIFEESEPWKNYCEFAARRLKEKYFSDEEYWKDNGCTENVMISYGAFPIRLKLEMNEDMAKRLLTRGAERLDGRSFEAVFKASLCAVREGIAGRAPELIFLTGGVSRLPVIRTWCRETFPDAVVITGAEPEFSVSRGLAWSGRIDEQLREFREDLEKFKAGQTVENIVKDNINDLYHQAVDALVEPVLEHAAMPVFDRWRSGEIRKLSDIDKELEHEIGNYLRSNEARDLLVKPITRWLKPVADQLEEHTVPICVRHGVPYHALSLNSGLALDDIDIRIDTRDVFALGEITFLIDTIISLLVGLICGGSGIALVSAGLPGIAVGAGASLLVLLLGRERMEKLMLDMDIPAPARKLIPQGYFRSRLDSISSEVKANFYKSLETDKNEDITERLADEISQQIEQCLTKMAEVVEIPLG